MGLSIQLDLFISIAVMFRLPLLICATFLLASTLAVTVDQATNTDPIVSVFAETKQASLDDSELTTHELTDAQQTERAFDKQRTEMHDLAEHHDASNDNCHNKRHFGWSDCGQFDHGHFGPSDALHKCRGSWLYCVVRPKSGLRQSMLGLPVPQVLLRQVATSTSGITMRSPLPCPVPQQAFLKEY